MDDDDDNDDEDDEDDEAAGRRVAVRPPTALELLELLEDARASPSTLKCSPGMDAEAESAAAAAAPPLLAAPFIDESSLPCNILSFFSSGEAPFASPLT